MSFDDAFNRDSDLCLCGRITRRSEHPVAGGGFADVFEGHFENRKVAIKVMRMFTSTGGRIQQDRLLKRLWREYLVWSQLTHPNVLQCLGFSFDFSPEESHILPSLISPWQANGTVNSYLKKNRDTDRLKLLVGVAEGLSHLHTRPHVIVHGDLRGGNVLVSEQGVPYLIDFGLSRVLKEHRGMTTSPELMGMTTSTEVAGSVRWMSPELLHDDREVTVQSDIWAYGMTALEIFSGEYPYFDVVRDVIVIGKIRDGHLPSRPLVSKLLSDKIWFTCQRCWARPPSHRPSMQEVISLLLKPDQQSEASTTFTFSFGGEPSLSPPATPSSQSSTQTLRQVQSEEQYIAPGMFPDDFDPGDPGLPPRPIGWTIIEAIRTLTSKFTSIGGSDSLGVEE